MNLALVVIDSNSKNLLKDGISWLAKTTWVYKIEIILVEITDKNIMSKLIEVKENQKKGISNLQ